MGYSDFMNFGLVLRHYRTEKHFSQENLSEGICDRKQISNIECGKCSPTLNLINLLSKKLDVDLYTKYSEVMHHKNLETHKAIEEINEHLHNSKELSKILPILEACETKEEFSSGEPYQILQYGYAGYYISVDKDYLSAKKHLLNALLDHYEDEADIFSKDNHFSNIELACLLSLASVLNELNETVVSKKYYNDLLKYCFELFTESRYTINSNYHFELNLIGRTVYNYVKDHRESSDETERYINNALALLKKYDSSGNLFEVLLSKAYVEFRKGNNEYAKELLCQSKAIGTIYRSEAYIQKIMNSLDFEK